MPSRPIETPATTPEPAEPRSLRKLPPIPTNRTLTKRRHWLIRTPRLRLTIADLLLPALATRQRRTNTLLLLCCHRLPQVLLLHALVFRLALFASQFLVFHGDEAGGGNGAVEDGGAEVRVGFGFEVLVEGAHFGFVGFRAFRLVDVVGC